MNYLLRRLREEGVIQSGICLTFGLPRLADEIPKRGRFAVVHMPDDTRPGPFWAMPPEDARRMIERGYKLHPGSSLDGPVVAATAAPSRDHHLCVPVAPLLKHEGYLPTECIASLLPPDAMAGLTEMQAGLELLEAFRIRLLDDVLIFYVEDIEWHGPHEPAGVWTPEAVLPATAPLKSVGATLKRLLKKRRYFVVCRECGELNRAGHTEGEICYPCLERSHGAAF
ncbi:hypothetical protein [Xenophilus azovorans]|uniref:hypothetical protein n=1 Tax=Xenophilus azovorans TaxID=151755 RepID=UPI00056E0992|nr:hypothetical protein [Xenophilus azovorans]